jgi:hypothetical protein
LALNAAAVNVVVTLLPAITFFAVGLTLRAKSVTVIDALPVSPSEAVAVNVTVPVGAAAGAV